MVSRHLQSRFDLFLNARWAGRRWGCESVLHRVPPQGIATPGDGVEVRGRSGGGTFGISDATTVLTDTSWIVCACAKHQMVAQHVVGVEVGSVALGRTQRQHLNFVLQSLLD